MITAELDPDNTNYWESLFRIYTSLGMLEEAEAGWKKQECNLGLCANLKFVVTYNSSST